MNTEATQNPAPQTHVLWGRIYNVLATFPVGPQGTKDANDFMAADGIACVLDESDGRIILACKTDQGIPAPIHERNPFEHLGHIGFASAGDGAGPDEIDISAEVLAQLELAGKLVGDLLAHGRQTGIEPKLQEAATQLLVALGQPTE